MERGSKDSARLFAAVSLDQPAHACLIEAQQKLRPLIEPGAVRWTRPEQMHLTIQFFGKVHVSNIPSLTAVLARAATHSNALSLTIDGLGIFPERGTPRVLWAGVTGEISRLHALQTEIAAGARSLVECVEDRPFKPHLTLARFKGPVGNPRQFRETISKKRLLNAVSWHISEVHLIESTLSSKGSAYSTVASFELGANAPSQE